MVPLHALASAVLALISAAAPIKKATRPEVEVPFGCGLSFPVSQAHATGSHLYKDTWAWDFRMPAGTPVVAAMEGTVRLARGDSRVGGCDPELGRHANYVVLAHDRGLETQYLHFREVTVKPGDKVRAGELLGYSGETGWACGAHLHFKVALQKDASWNNLSIPALIAGYGDPQPGVLIVAPACPAPAPKMADAAGLPSEPAPPAAVPDHSASGAPKEALGGASKPAEPAGAPAAGPTPEPG